MKKIKLGVMKDTIIQRIIKIKSLISNWALFSVIFAYLFIWPYFSSSSESLVFNLFLSLVIVLSIFAVAKEQSKAFIFHLLIAIIAVWLLHSVESLLLIGIMRFVVIFYFFSIVIRFIKLVYRRKVVDTFVIIEAINGYLLLGIGFSLLIYVSGIYFPNAFNFVVNENSSVAYDPIYYSFVTLTTLGYGDKLPMGDVAKSISLLITLSGQFYLVTVMASIVGKMMTQRGD